MHLAVDPVESYSKARFGRTYDRQVHCRACYSKRKTFSPGPSTLVDHILPTALSAKFS